MDAYLKAFWLPKEGSTEGEYEDAFLPCEARGYPIRKRQRFAIADGATETSFSRLWAQLLVRGFVRRALAVPPTMEQLKPLQERWRSKVGGKSLPWYAEEKMSYGAFAALLGLELSEEEGEAGTVRNWQATAAGDCCLVQVRDNAIVDTFPFADSSAFNSRPDLLASLTAFNGPQNELVKTAHGTWRGDDTFFLMTDALACWFFKQVEIGNRPWVSLSNLDHQELANTFPEFVEDLRDNMEMKNDDVTLMRIDIR
jgi:hypothetical protein